MKKLHIFTLYLVAVFFSAVIVSCQKEEIIPEWNKTSRLLVDNLVDNENAVRVLRAEATASDGLLSIDTAPHFILVNE